jgi:hypothetical protein
MPRGPPRAVTQTAASGRFHVFGDPRDPAFRDLSPVDGIDDRRHAPFLGLAERFAPWLVRNAYGFPMDIRRLMSDSSEFPLVIDHFDLSRTPAGCASPACSTTCCPTLGASGPVWNCFP